MTILDLVRVKYSLRNQKSLASRARQDGHGELHRQAGGGEGGAGEGGVRPEDHVSDGGEAGPGAEAGRGEEARRGDQLPEEDQPAQATEEADPATTRQRQEQALMFEKYLDESGLCLSF